RTFQNQKSTYEKYEIDLKDATACIINVPGSTYGDSFYLIIFANPQQQLRMESHQCVNTTTIIGYIIDRDNLSSYFGPYGKSILVSAKH
ncbi:12855_t:CDS:2, partial [Funneliformis geosporum]